METTILTEAVKQLPALVVLVGLVLKFLAFIKESEDRCEKSEASRLEALKHLGDACHRSQTDMMERYEDTMSKVTEALDRNTGAMGRAGAVADRLEDWLEHFDGKHGPIRKKTP